MEEGLTILHDAIMVELATTGNAVTVFGWSQSAIIASLEMQRFTAMGGAAPSASDLNFVLVGNEMNPNGGMLARFPDLTLPTLDLTFYGATLRLGLEHNLAEHTAVVQTLQRGLCFRQRIALRRRRSEPQKDQLV